MIYIALWYYVVIIIRINKENITHIKKFSDTYRELSCKR